MKYLVPRATEIGGVQYASGATVSVTSASMFSAFRAAERLSLAQEAADYSLVTAGIDESRARRGRKLIDGDSDATISHGIVPVGLTAGSPIAEVLSPWMETPTIVPGYDNGGSVALSGNVLVTTSTGANPGDVPIRLQIGSRVVGFNLLARQYVGGPATASPSMPTGLVARFRARDITPQADNTNLASWTDSISGAVASQATSANQPKYRTNQKNGLPGIQFAGTQSMPLSSFSAISTALDSQEYTLVMVMSGTSAGTDTFNSPFGSFTQGQGAGIMTLAGASCGYGAYSGGPPVVPYTSDLDAFSTLAIAGTVTATAGIARNTSLYVNGGRVQSRQDPPGTNGGQTPVIGAPGGGWSSYMFKGILYDIYVFNRQLTGAEMKQVEKAIRFDYGVALPWAGKSSYPVFAGDSITAGQVGASGPTHTYPYVAAQSLGLKYGQWDNAGRGGATLVDLLTVAAGDIDNVAAQTGIPTLLSFWEFYNDRTASSPSADALAYLNARISAGTPASRIVFGTTCDYTGQGAEKATYTGYWDTAGNRTGKMGGYVPIHNNANIGANGAAASGTYFADGVHLTDAGYSILAGLFSSVLSGVI